MPSPKSPHEIRFLVSHLSINNVPLQVRKRSRSIWLPIGRKKKKWGWNEDIYMFWTIELCVKYSNWGHWTPVSLDMRDKMRKSGWKQYRRRRRRRKKGGRGRGESNYVSHLNWFLRGSFVHPQFWICLSSVPWLLAHILH